METLSQIQVQAPPERVYALAAAVERWPELLPHYRWVRVLGQRGERERLVEMAARRDWIPVRWGAIQRLHPERQRIEFLHVRGLTRGMKVEWRIEPDGPGGSEVRIWHAF